MSAGTEADMTVQVTQPGCPKTSSKCSPVSEGLLDLSRNTMQRDHLLWRYTRHSSTFWTGSEFPALLYVEQKAAVAPGAPWVALRPSAGGHTGCTGGAELGTLTQPLLAFNLM